MFYCFFPLKIGTEKLIDEAESEVEVFTSTLLMLQQQLSIAHSTIEVLAVALASSSPSPTSGSTTACASSPHQVDRCIALLRAAQWPLPAALEQKARESTEAAQPSEPTPAPSSTQSPLPSALRSD